MNQVPLRWDVPPAWTLVPQQTIVELLLDAAGQRPASAALIFEDGPVVSVRQLLELAESFAGYLSERIEPGQPVAVMLPNRAEFMVAWLAVVACRGMLVSVNPSAQAFDAGHILRDSGAVLAITDTDNQALLERVKPDCPALRKLVTVADGCEPEGLSAFRGVEPMRFADSESVRDDVTNVYYTSGTTGPPKGCLLSHEHWLRVVDVDLRLHPKGPSDRMLCCLQFFYSDPAWQLVAALASGASVVVMRRFSVSRFWDVVRRHQVTEILAIASIPILLLKAPPDPRDRDHRVKRALQVAVPANLHREMNERWGFPWVDGYGITEGGFVTRVPLDAADELVGSGSIGIPCPEVELRLVGDAGAEVPTGEVGEFVMRAPGMMRGYLHRADATAEALRDGWLHTGDLGRADERGLLWIVGRKKDMIRRSGENVAAAEIETVLRSHPKVLEAAVIPVPDPLRGEEIKAYVLPVAGESVATLPPLELVAHCQARLAPFKVPRYFEYRSTDFPRTPSMRVRKELLREGTADLTSAAWDRERPT
ncbi:MAG: AMP-binding protein [Chloroflexi bacterium]|nr:AMP-binding protein [Chloroflexota bacterium]